MKNSNENSNDIMEKQDLCIAVMHLINIEEHLAFTAMKTKRKEYMEVLNSVRKLRIKLLKILLKNKEGELWCVSKHLLSATMRLMETSSNYLEQNKEKAYDIMKNAFDTYSLFWFLQGIGGFDNDRRVRKKSKQMENKSS